MNTHCPEQNNGAAEKNEIGSELSPWCNISGLPDGFGADALLIVVHIIYMPPEYVTMTSISSVALEREEAKLR